jgi:phosphate transport system permease protein
MLRRFRQPWTDAQAQRRLGAVACFVLFVIVAMIVFVTIRAWPTLTNNGFVSWLGPGGNVDTQMNGMIVTNQHPPPEAYHLRAWPLVYATLITSIGAVLVGLVISIFSAIFIVEFSPARLKRIVEPAVKLLAAVPSVIYGLIGILVLVPFIGNHIITEDRKESVQNVVQIDGTGLLVSILVLAIMVTPIMIALIVEALNSVPTAWKEGAAALGANRWETIWSVSIRASRPAIVAAAVMSGARALGEAVMLSMISGSRGFAPNFLDGSTVLFEPLRPVAATMVEQVDALNAPAIKSTIYAFALLLLFSSLMLSIGGYLARLPMRKQGLRV